MRIPPARSLGFTDLSADVLLIGGASLVTFYNFTEATASGTAHVRLWDGTDTSGTLLASITLTANESTRDLIPEPCLIARSGVFVEVVAGTVEGAVWVVPETLLAPYSLTQGYDQFWGQNE